MKTFFERRVRDGATASPDLVKEEAIIRYYVNYTCLAHVITRFKILKTPKSLMIQFRIVQSSSIYRKLYCDSIRYLGKSTGPNRSGSCEFWCRPAHKVF